MTLLEKHHTIHRVEFCKLEIKNIYQEQIVSVYTASVINTFKNINPNVNSISQTGTVNIGEQILLFKFKYYPLFEFSARTNLCKIYKETPQFINLLELIEFRYFSLYKNCINFYVEKLSTSTNKEVFLKNEIEIFKKFDYQDGSYYLFGLFDKPPMQNPNLLVNFKQLISYIQENEINDINLLLEENRAAQSSSKRIKLVRGLFSSIDNIVYNRFLEFLVDEKEKCLSNSQDSLPEIKFATLKNAEIVFERAVRNGLMDDKFKESFIKLAKNEKPTRKIVWNKSLNLLKGFVEKCYSKEIKILPIDHSGGYDFIHKFFRPNIHKKNKIRDKGYSITRIQSTNYPSKRNGALLEKIFHKL